MNKIIHSLLFLFIGLYSYSIEISYTLLNGTKSTINIPNDVIEINAFKGNMNFVRSNEEIITLRTTSPMIEIIGIENLTTLTRMELSMQLHSENYDFIKSTSLEYLLIG